MDKKLLASLQALRAKGAKVFLCSNSYYEIAEVLMREGVGEDWKKYFDFALFDTRKPGFFLKEEPFTDVEGEVVSDVADVLLGRKQGVEKVLLGGNSRAMNEVFAKNIRKNFKVLFYGDTIVSDCVYSYQSDGIVGQHHWDIVLILEELQEIEQGIETEQYFKYWKAWGSALIDKNIYSGVDQTNIFDFADNIAHRCFSLLDSKESLEFLTI